MTGGTGSMKAPAAVPVSRTRSKTSSQQGAADRANRSSRGAGSRQQPMLISVQLTIVSENDGSEEKIMLKN